MLSQVIIATWNQWKHERVHHVANMFMMQLALLFTFYPSSKLAEGGDGARRLCKADTRCYAAQLMEGLQDYLHQQSRRSMASIEISQGKVSALWPRCYFYNNE